MSPTSSSCAARASTTSRSTSCEIPKRQLVVFTGVSRLGQVDAGLRHALRRGPAPLRRDAVGVRAPVPRADGEAASRAPARAVADHRHRAEDRVEQPALDRRHHHRDLRLPARALRARRASSTATCAASRSAARSAAEIVDELLHAAGRDASVHAARAAGRATARASSASCSRRRARRGFARVRVDGKRPAARGRPRARQEAEAHHRARGRPRQPSTPASRARLTETVEIALEGGRRLDAGRRRGRGARARLQRGARLPAAASASPS